MVVSEMILWLGDAADDVVVAERESPEGKDSPEMAAHSELVDAVKSIIEPFSGPRSPRSTKPLPSRGMPSVGFPSSRAVIVLDR